MHMFMPQVNYTWVQFTAGMTESNSQPCVRLKSYNRHREHQRSREFCQLLAQHPCAVEPAGDHFLSNIALVLTISVLLAKTLNKQ